MTGHECGICYETVAPSSQTKLRCNDVFCKSCFAKYVDNHAINDPLVLRSQHDKIIRCPLCRHEFVQFLTKQTKLLTDTLKFDYKHIICKVYFKHGFMYHLLEPMQIFLFTCKSHLTTVDDNYACDSNWLHTMTILVRLLIPIYESKPCKEPLTLYIYHDPETTIKLKSKQDDSLDAVDARDFFSGMTVDGDTIDDFIDSWNASMLAGILRTIEQ